jgi:hypothetical protein
MSDLWRVFFGSGTKLGRTARGVGLRLRDLLSTDGHRFRRYGSLRERIGRVIWGEHNIEALSFSLQCPTTYFCRFYEKCDEI